MNTKQWKITSSIGPIYLIAGEKGLCQLSFKKRSAPMATSLSETGQPVKILAQAAQELESYFSGKLKTFSVRLDPEGTPFQKRVWKELSKIPYGVTRSYKEVAERIQHQKAFRAVGTANGRNPLPIIVPCHRVIAADGSLGGYSGGLGIKTKLLKLEKALAR